MMTVKIINQGTIAKGLQSFQDRMDGRKGTLYPDLGKMVKKSITANFATEGRDPKWLETQNPWPVLNLTGTMRDDAERSALAKWIFAGPIRYLRIYGPEYGSYHQYGTKRLPERKYVKFTVVERMEMIDRIRQEWRAAWQGQ